MFIFLKTELLQYQHWICVLFRFYCIKAPTRINFSVACKTQFISEDCKSQSLLVNMSRGKNYPTVWHLHPDQKGCTPKKAVTVASFSRVRTLQATEPADRQMPGSCSGSRNRNRMLLGGRKLPLPVVTFKSIIQPQREQEGNDIYFPGLADFPSQILNCSCKSQSP